jgi:hypothetical protein
MRSQPASKPEREMRRENQKSPHFLFCTGGYRMAKVDHVFGRDEVSHLLFADVVARKYKDWRFVSLEEVNSLHCRLKAFTSRRGMSVFDLDNLLVIPSHRIGALLRRFFLLSKWWL